MTKAALEALKNSLLAGSQPITAAIHRTFEQNVIDELYDVVSRGKVLAGAATVLSLTSGDQVLMIRGGNIYRASKDLFGGGGGGVTTFVGLTDVPSSYTGQSLKGVRVNAGETALEFYTTGGGGGGSVTSVNSGSGVTVDNTDPTNPIVNLGGQVVGGFELYPDVDNTQSFIIGAGGDFSKWAQTVQVYSRGTIDLNSDTDGLGTNFAGMSITNASGVAFNGTGTGAFFSVGMPSQFGSTVLLAADPTLALEAATKQYVDAAVVGLWDDRGTFSAAGGAYPSSGGSGAAGAILKGDIWTISTGGTLPTGQVVEAGDTVRAMVDTPGNTQANWAIGQNNLGYVPLTNTLNSGNIFVGNVSNVATGVAMSGQATISNTGAVTLDNASVIGKVLTGYVSGAGTVSATDTILQAIQKLNGNIVASTVVNPWLGASGVTMTGANTINGAFKLTFSNSVTAASGTGYGIEFNPTVVAAANSDLLRGLSVAPVFTNGAFTGITNSAVGVAHSLTASAPGVSNLNGILVRGTYNLTGTYSGTIAGYRYAPTLTSMTGALHYAFHATSGAFLFTTETPSLNTMTGTYTTTANNQFFKTVTPTITARGTASDNIYVSQWAPTIIYGANDQTGTALHLNVTTTPGAFTGLNSNFMLMQNAGTTVYEVNANGTFFFGSAVSNRPRIAISNTAGAASVSGITLRVGGSWTNADSCAVYLTTGNTTFTSTGTFNGRMQEIAFPSCTWSSGGYSPSGLVITGAIAGSGSWSGTLRAVDINITGTRSVGTHYGITVRNTDLYNGLGVASPTAVLHLGASTTARASLRIDNGTAPTSPNNGDIWQDGTDIKMRIGGVTKTFTLI